MKALLIWFYCLPVGQVVLLLLLGAAAFHRIKCRWQDHSLFVPVVGSLFVIWMAALAFATVFTRHAGETYSVNPTLFHSYQEVFSGGNPELLRSNLMNAVLFLPGGMLLGAMLPRRWNRWLRVLLGLALLGSLSAAVESIQFLWELGQVEADDLFHNALGALAGLIIGTIHPKV